MDGMPRFTSAATALLLAAAMAFPVVAGDAPGTTAKS